VKPGGMYPPDAALSDVGFVPEPFHGAPPPPGAPPPAAPLGFSPNSAIRLSYSESNFVGGAPVPGGGAPPNPLGCMKPFGSPRRWVQSRAMWPALPQTRQIMLAV